MDGTVGRNLWLGRWGDANGQSPQRTQSDSSRQALTPGHTKLHTRSGRSSGSPSSGTRRLPERKAQWRMADPSGLQQRGLRRTGRGTHVPGRHRTSRFTPSRGCTAGNPDRIQRAAYAITTRFGKRLQRHAACMLSPDGLAWTDGTRRAAHGRQRHRPRVGGYNRCAVYGQEVSRYFSCR